MVRPKNSLKKQQKRGGVDFKKIKRKVGRKLPPPKNETNTQIKSKAIVLPEQSVASERSGLAVSKKGLTLKELLQQTSHYSPKVRRDALIGIKDLLTKYPEELKLHKYAVIEKLRERVSDEDKFVRETLYQLFKSVVFPGCKEDQGPLIPLLMTYVFNAMTHLAIDVRIMALRFIDLILQNHPASFSSYAEKILQNYENLLHENQFYLQENNKLKNVLTGLMYCLSLLPFKKEEVDTSCKKDIPPQSVLHAFDHDTPKDSIEFPGIAKNLKNLMPVLVTCFHEFVPLVSQQLDAQSFECMLYALQSVELAVRFFLHGTENRQPELQVPVTLEELIMWGQTLSSVVFKKLWDVFPLNPTQHFSEKDDERYFIVNLVITKIFLQLFEWILPPVTLLEKFIIFIEGALARKIAGTNLGKAHVEKHILSLLLFLPKFISKTESYWTCFLLQAFTSTFRDCKPESSLKLACLSIVEEMLLPRDGMLFLDVTDPDTLGHISSWIRELPFLLIQLGDRHPSCSKAVLHLLLRLGQHAVLNTSFANEYDNLELSLLEFFCTFPDEGSICYGPFVNISRDLQELSVSCLRYFSRLDPLLLKALASCCLCHELEPFTLFRIIEVLHSSYKAGHIQIGDHISFFNTLLARFKVLPEKLYPVSSDWKISNRQTYKSVTGVISSCLSQMGDDSLVLKITENCIYDEMSQKPSLDNMCALLRVLVVLDFRLPRVSEESVINLGNLLPGYLMDIACCTLEGEDELNSICFPERQYYLTPCFMLFERSFKLLNLVLNAMGSLVAEFNMVVKTSIYGKLLSDDSIRIKAIVSVLLCIIKEIKLKAALVLCKEEINRIMQSICLVQSSKEKKLTLEGRQRIKVAFNRLSIVASTL